MSLIVYTECHSEKLLYELFFSDNNKMKSVVKSIKHIKSNGKPDVLNKLIQVQQKQGEHYIGITDKETPGKNTHPEYSKFKIIDKQHQLILKQYPKRNSWLIELDSQFETWLIQLNKGKNKIDHNKYSIRTFTKDGLHEIFGKFNISLKHKEFISTVLNANPSQRATITNWIIYHIKQRKK